MSHSASSDHGPKPPTSQHLEGSCETHDDVFQQQVLKGNKASKSTAVGSSSKKQADNSQTKKSAAECVAGVQRTEREARELLASCESDDGEIDEILSSQPIVLHSVQEESSSHVVADKTPTRLSAQTKATERPRSRTPINIHTFEDYTNQSEEQTILPTDKISITLPKPVKPRSRGTDKSPRKEINNEFLFSKSKSSVVITRDKSPQRVLFPNTSESKDQEFWGAFDDKVKEGESKNERPDSFFAEFDNLETSESSTTEVIEENNPFESTAVQELEDSFTFFQSAEMEGSNECNPGGVDETINEPQNDQAGVECSDVMDTDHQSLVYGDGDHEAENHVDETTATEDNDIVTDAEYTTGGDFFSSTIYDEDDSYINNDPDEQSGEQHHESFQPDEESITNEDISDTHNTQDISVSEGNGGEVLPTDNLTEPVLEQDTPVSNFDTADFDPFAPSTADSPTTDGQYDGYVEELDPYSQGVAEPQLEQDVDCGTELDACSGQDTVHEADISESDSQQLSSDVTIVPAYASDAATDQYTSKTDFDVSHLDTQLSTDHSYMPMTDVNYPDLEYVDSQQNSPEEAVYSAADHESDHMEEQGDQGSAQPDISEMDSQFLEDMGITRGHGGSDGSDGHDTDTETDIQTGILANKKPPPPRPPAPSKPSRPPQPRPPSKDTQGSQRKTAPKAPTTAKGPAATKGAKAPSGASTSKSSKTAGKPATGTVPSTGKSAKVVGKIHKAAEKAHVVGQIVKASLKESIKVPKDPNANPNLKKLRKKKLAKGDDLESVVKACNKATKPGSSTSSDNTQKPKRPSQSADYQEFQAIQERIKATVQQSQENITKLKTHSSTTESEGEKTVSWVSFDDNKMNTAASAWGEVDAQASQEEAKGFDDDFSGKNADPPKPVVMKPVATVTPQTTKPQTTAQSKKGANNAQTKKTPPTRPPPAKAGPPRPKQPVQVKPAQAKPASTRPVVKPVNKPVVKAHEAETSYSDDIEDIDNLDFSMRTEPEVTADTLQVTEETGPKPARSTADLLGMNENDSNGGTGDQQTVSNLEKELMNAGDSDLNMPTGRDSYIDSFLGITNEIVIPEPKSLDELLSNPTTDTLLDKETAEPINGDLLSGDNVGITSSDLDMFDVGESTVDVIEEVGETEQSVEPSQTEQLLTQPVQVPIIKSPETKRHRSAQKPKEIDASVIAVIMNTQLKTHTHVVEPETKVTSLLPQPSVDDPEFAEFLAERKGGKDDPIDDAFAEFLAERKEAPPPSGLKPAASESNLWGKPAEDLGEHFATELEGSLEHTKEFTGNLFSDTIEDIPPELEKNNDLGDFLGGGSTVSDASNTNDLDKIFGGPMEAPSAGNTSNEIGAFLGNVEKEPMAAVPQGDDLDPFAPSPPKPKETNVDPFFRSFSQTITDDDLLDENALVPVTKPDDPFCETEANVQVEQKLGKVADNGPLADVPFADDGDEEEEEDDEEEEEDDEVEEVEQPVKEPEKEKSNQDEKPKRTKIIPVEEPKPTPTSVKPVPRPKPKDGKIEVVIKPATADGTVQETPTLAPPPKIQPPKSPMREERINPFDKDSTDAASGKLLEFEGVVPSDQMKAEPADGEPGKDSVDSTNVPSLSVCSSVEEDTGEPLPPFHPPFEGDYWTVMLRLPTKKHSPFSKLTNTMNAMTNKRFWKEVYMRLVKDGEKVYLRIYNKLDELKAEKMAVQEITLQPCYSLSNIFEQQFDQYGKIHTFKLQYVCYKERVGVRTDRLSEAIPSFMRGHTKPKPNMILDHAPQTSEVLKFGAKDYCHIRSLLWVLEDELMRLPGQRERSLTYTKDEITVELRDEYKAEIDKAGHILSQISRIRMFCLAFVSGDPEIEIGINDRRRDGKEVVGRHDIIPIKTEEWIHVLEPEFHSVVNLEVFEETNAIKFKPLDACRFELMRCRTRLKINRELPLQVSARTIINPKHVEIRADVLIPGYFSTKKKEGQIPCEDIEIRFPIPEPWIYLFRVEKRFGYGSIKSALRKPGKIKGLERITMIAQGVLPPSLIEVSTGTAKYENVFKSVVWRIPRLPDKNEGAYKTHLFVMRLDLGPHDVIPEDLESHYTVEYTMPNTTISRSQVRSISATTEDPPEKWVKLKGSYAYNVEMEYTNGETEKEENVPAAPVAGAEAASSGEGESEDEEEEKEWKSDFSSDEDEEEEEEVGKENEKKEKVDENVETLVDMS